jgi:hypothetical protein
MTPSVFRLSLSKDGPPPDLASPLQALWWVAKGDWPRAHRIVQDEEGADAAWVHGYLHRVEGDLGNARHWYRQAKRPPATGDLQSEWAVIAAQLIGPRQGDVGRGR